MHYYEVAEIKDRAGLRLVTPRGGPNLLAECAKAIFALKGLDYVTAVQYPGQPNEALQAWTGYRNAPLAVWNKEPARGRWYEILLMAERLAPEPPLVPLDRELRAQVMGISNEIMGEDGYAWNWRLRMFPDPDSHKDLLGSEWAGIMQQSYGASPNATGQALGKLKAILKMLSDRLHAQRARDIPYLVGDSLTACDIYWAVLSIGAAQVSETLCTPMPLLQDIWLRLRQELDGAIDPILVEHRDYIFEKHLPSALDF